jgi:hypothetical protein
MGLALSLQQNGFPFMDVWFQALLLQLAQPCSLAGAGVPLLAEASRPKNAALLESTV